MIPRKPSLPFGNAALCRYQKGKVQLELAVYKIQKVNNDVLWQVETWPCDLEIPDIAEELKWPAASVLGKNNLMCKVLLK